MRGRIYTVAFDNVAVSAAQDLLQFEMFNLAVVAEILSARVSQVTDAGESSSQSIRIQWVNWGNAKSSGGSSVTPRPHESGDAAATSTVTRNNTTPGSGIQVFHTLIWNTQIPWMWIQQPIARRKLHNHTGFALRLPDAPGSSINVSASITFREWT